MAQQIRIDRRFAIIDEWVLDLPVSDRAIRLYAVLARYADHNTHKAFPSRRTLSERLRCSMKSVDRAVQELVDCGALSKEQRFNSSLVFTLNTVWTEESRGVDSGDEGGWTPVTRGVDTGDDLTRTTQQEPKEQKPTKRVQPKSADDFTPSPAITDTFETDWPGLRLDLELAKFRDHHAAKGSTFKDWDRAFRNWLRRSSEWSPEARKMRAWAEWEKETERLIAEEEGNQ